MLRSTLSSEAILSLMEMYLRGGSLAQGQLQPALMLHQEPILSGEEYSMRWHGNVWRLCEGLELRRNESVKKIYVCSVKGMDVAM